MIHLQWRQYSLSFRVRLCRKSIGWLDSREEEGAVSSHAEGIQVFQILCRNGVWCKVTGVQVNGKTDKLSYVISSVTVVAVIAKVTAEIWEHGDISTMKLNKARDSILSLTFSLPLFVGVYLQPVWTFF